MEGWIKLHRKLLTWEWFTIPNMVHLFIYMLLSANHQDGKWKGIELKRGQLITGLKVLNKNTGISVRSLRTCIERLKSTGELTVKATNKYSTITICNYDLYNDIINNVDKQIDSQTDKPPTRNRHAIDNKQEYKNDKNVKDILPKEKNIPLRKEEEIKEEENTDVECYDPSDFATAIKETGTAEPECAAKIEEMKNFHEVVLNHPDYSEPFFTNR